VLRLSDELVRIDPHVVMVDVAAAEKKTVGYAAVTPVDEYHVVDDVTLPCPEHSLPAVENRRPLDPPTFCGNDAPSSISSHSKL